MSSVKVVLFTSKKLKNGEHPLMIRFIKDRKVKYLSVGHSCLPSLWDNENNEPKRKHPNYRELLIFIDKKKTEANKLLLNLEIEKEDFTIDELKQKYRVATKKITVLNYVDQIIEQLQKENRMGYAISHKDLKRVLLKYRQGKDFNFSDIDQAFLNKFEQDFRTQGISENSMGVYFRTLRSIYNKAIKEGYAKKGSYPFDEYKVSQLKEATRKRAITKADVQKIEALHTEKESNLFNAQSFFLFSYYCSGINFVDVAKLGWGNIRQSGDSTFLEYTRSKTGKAYTIQLLPPALRILEYYKSLRQGNYIFPFLDKDRHKSAATIDNRIKKTKRQVNSDLKEIAKSTSIDVILTTYVARHTFATVLKRTGVSTSKISELMGHSSESITQVYLDSFEQDDLFEATKNLL